MFNCMLQVWVSCIFCTQHITNTSFNSYSTKL